MSNQAYEIVRRADGRFVISDSTTMSVLDDAQGYGYTTKQKAEKAAWYRFKGGKAKLDTAKQEANSFWRSHTEFSDAVSDLLETWFKEIARGEIVADMEVSKLAVEMGVEGFDAKFLEYLP